MANLQSAKKKVRQSEKKRLQNKVLKSAMRTQIKKFLSAVEAQDPQAAQIELSKTMGALDKMSQKKIIHDNNVARQKAKLHQKYNALVAATKSAPAKS